MNVFKRFFLLMCIALIFSTHVFAQDSLIEDKNEFIQQVLTGLNSDSVREQERAAQLLANKGIMVPAIYERIASMIKTYSTMPVESKQYRAIAWLVKGLAYSGDNDYRPIIEGIVEKSRKSVKRHAQKALKILDRAIVLTPILNKEDLYTGNERWDLIREANIIRWSQDYEWMKRIAKDTINYKNYEPVLLDAMNSSVRSGYQESSENKTRTQAYAFMLKAMAIAPKPHYVETLKEVSISAKDKKLKRYAEKFYQKRQQLFMELARLKANDKYHGEAFGYVSVSFKKPEDMSTAKIQSFEEMGLKSEIQQMLDQSYLWEEGSPYSLHIDITSYRVRSKGSKVAAALLIPGAEKIGAGVIGPDVLSAEVTIKHSKQTIGPDFTVASVDVDLLDNTHYGSLPSGEAFLALRFARNLNAKLETAVTYLQ
ncbi:MAG: hypothetical protein ACRBEE_07525 [Arenicella sp.]